MASVLIVEDEKSLRETLTRFLKREGHEVISAADGREAFDHGISAEPEILVTDWMLKNHIHGLHISEAFKAINPSLHTILITGFPSKDLLSESDRGGVLQLLEKPFDLEELRRAVANASQAKRLPGRSSPLAVIELDLEGKLHFVSERAHEFFGETAGGRGASQLQDVLGPEVMSQLSRAKEDWVSCTTLADNPPNAESPRWLVRARLLTERQGYLVVLLREDELPLTSDPRVRILLDHRSRSKPILPDHGPVVVVEPDGAVRRLLVSQIERIGTLCYPTDDIVRALKLLSAEPRTATVLIDFQLAGERMEEWVDAVRAARPGVTVIGTGGSGSEEDLLAVGVTRVLPKPWRIMDLLDAMTQ
ncbi:MAG: DNA-binding NtrC family response regulator [Myxococcota bacterium]|jgi:DNA-binding NtrC family response regulator